MVSEEDLKGVGTIELCAAYGDKLFGLEKVKKELIARLLSYQHGLGDITLVQKDKSGNIIVLHPENSGKKTVLPDKGEISDELEKARKSLRKWMKKRRPKNLPPDGWEWELIEKGEIKNGMTQCGLLASWGKPTYLGRKVGRVQEWIYDKFLKHGTVYVKKGKIKKWEQ